MPTPTPQSLGPAAEYAAALNEGRFRIQHCGACDRHVFYPRTSHPPAFVLGNATAVWNRQISAMHDLTVTAAQESGARAFEMAGLSPKDVDVAMLYDAFTINTLLFLEDLGCCAKGESGAFVENGAIAPGGRLAVNTNGGTLSNQSTVLLGTSAVL